ncbi:MULTISPECIES: YihY/virulence factor BrkB family protein [Streptomyces]|uniref:YihY/virulence factor BrkB family protein n=3 Tax=Streptomyces TaxID=1883 RepID=A0A3Q9FW43_STRLT|nr:YihY/virulence factor BrkB family protein [Streptomyces luteoverticillatus]AZQ73134.1 YihY/virulence factor BrkB family protein [Streptomyces luteoverticillatus]
MDWLTRLPLIGPLVAKAMRTHAWRAYDTLDRVKWTRLAAAITFSSFVALFPLLTLGAAVAASVLSDQQTKELERRVAEQVPSGALDVGSFTDNAGTVGLVAGGLLLFTGISWLGQLRECLRAVWEVEEDPGNLLLLKVKDVTLLLGLGGVFLLSAGCSAFASAAVGWVVKRAGLEGVGGLLTALGFCIAVLADFLLMLYVLSRLPGVHPERRRLVTGALLGAVGFELLKLVLSGYLRGVAARSMYGAFGTPIALLLWINFTAKLTLYCAAWTATDGAATRHGEKRELSPSEGSAGS